jgi:hypothetical protein
MPALLKGLLGPVVPDAILDVHLLIILGVRGWATFPGFMAASCVYIELFGDWCWSGPVLEAFWPYIWTAFAEYLCARFMVDLGGILNDRGGFDFVSLERPTDRL